MFFERHRHLTDDAVRGLDAARGLGCLAEALLQQHQAASRLFELAWLARHERITLTIPLRSWLEQLGGQVRSIGITPAIADAAVSLPSSFPGDPADRLIYATAVEYGWRLVTKDERLRAHRHPRPLTLW